MDKRKKYKQNQKDRGIARFELMVPNELKVKFEEMAHEIASEYLKPNDQRRRLTKAKVQLLTELLENTNHEFFHLKDKLKKQEKLIKALSPTLKQAETTNDLPLPNSIKKLSDDPLKLKQLIFNLYQEKQTLTLKNSELIRRNTQYLELYETVLNENERIKK